MPLNEILKVGQRGQGDPTKGKYVGQKLENVDADELATHLGLVGNFGGSSIFTALAERNGVDFGEEGGEPKETTHKFVGRKLSTEQYNKACDKANVSPEAGGGVLFRVWVENLLVEKGLLPAKG